MASDEFPEGGKMKYHYKVEFIGAKGKIKRIISHLNNTRLCRDIIDDQETDLPNEEVQKLKEKYTILDL